MNLPVPKTPINTHPFVPWSKRPRSLQETSDSCHPAMCSPHSLPFETPGNEKMDSLNLSLSLLAIDPQELRSEVLPFPNNRRNLLML